MSSTADVGKLQRTHGRCTQGDRREDSGSRGETNPLSYLCQDHYLTTKAKLKSLTCQTSSADTRAASRNVNEDDTCPQTAHALQGSEHRVVTQGENRQQGRRKTDCFPGLSCCSGAARALPGGQGGQRPGCRTLQPTHGASAWSSPSPAQSRGSPQACALGTESKVRESLKPGRERRQGAAPTAALPHQPHQPGGTTVTAGHRPWKPTASLPGESPHRRSDVAAGSGQCLRIREIPYPGMVSTLELGRKCPLHSSSRIIIKGK